MWVLGSKHSSSGGAAKAHNCWTTSPALGVGRLSPPSRRQKRKSCQFLSPPPRNYNFHDTCWVSYQLRKQSEYYCSDLVCTPKVHVLETWSPVWLCQDGGGEAWWKTLRSWGTTLMNVGRCVLGKVRCDRSKWALSGTGYCKNRLFSRSLAFCLSQW